MIDRLKGTICVVHMSNDENCYREISTSVADSNYVNVRFVEYDKMENVPTSKVRMIKYRQSQ